MRLTLLLFIVAAVPASAAAPAAAAPVVTLELDARDAPRRLLHARLSIPAAPGPMTLLYPKWIPGEHGPGGPVVDLAGLTLTAGGKAVPWHRDPVDMYAFHVDVPPGTHAIDVALDHILPAGGGNFTGGVSTTSHLAVLSWHQVVVYPKGRAADDLTYAASLRLPAGWKYGTALAVAKESPEAVSFQPVSLATLVDSPVITGAHFKTVALSASPALVVHMAADSTAALEMTPELKSAYERLVGEAHTLFGGRPYRSYSFLLTLSDHVRSFGLEHHESSDNRVPERALIDESQRKLRIGLLPHELVHAWNGKYRRPAGLMSPTFQEPMQGDLLWVYEGLTSYLGDVLAARSGLRSLEETRENLASIAGGQQATRGRTWRPLVDTAVAAHLLFNGRSDGQAWRRSVDFYGEGVLLWLEADTIIRRESRGKKSLDDFCRLFFKADPAPPRVVTYGFDDVVRALETVAPYDWRAFWKARLESVGPDAPLAGITASGWKLAWTEDPIGLLKAREDTGKQADARHSLGIVVGDDGAVVDVVPGSPADEAGLAPAMRLVAVNGRRFTRARLRAAIRETKAASRMIDLLTETGEFFKALRVEYAGGERHPALERVAAQPDVLSEILKPIAASKP